MLVVCCLRTKYVHSSLIVNFYSNIKCVMMIMIVAALINYICK